MQKTLTRVAAAALMLVPLLAVRVSAQTPLATGDPTRAGTEIKNTATVDFTDANGNTYADVSDDVTVTVAQVYALSVGAVTGNLAPTLAQDGSGTSASFQFDITNLGNDYDDIRVILGTLPAGISIDSMTVLDADDDASLCGMVTTTAAVDACIAAINTNEGVDYQGNGLGHDPDVRVVFYYHVAAGTGGTELTVPITIGSEDAGTETDETPSVVIIPQGVYQVDAQAEAAVERLRSNGATVVYSTTFTIVNEGNGPDSFGWSVSLSSGLTIASTTPSSGTTASLDENGSEQVTISYTVDDGTAPGDQTISITATSVKGGATITDGATHTVTVIMPTIEVVKEVFDGGTTESTTPSTTVLSGDPVPGQYLWYRITVTNNGTAEAEDIDVDDDLADQLEFRDAIADDELGTVTGPDWTLTEPAADSSGLVNGTLATLGKTESRVLWIRVRIK